MEWVEYIDELRQEYLVGRLQFDFIYAGLYDHLLSLALVPSRDSAEYNLAHRYASEYYMSYLMKYPKKLQDVKGERLYPVDFKEQNQKMESRIENYAKKYLVYDFIASGRAALLLNNNQNEGSTE